MCFSHHLCCFPNGRKDILFFVGKHSTKIWYPAVEYVAEQEFVMSSYLFPVLRIVNFIFTIEKMPVAANVCNVQWKQMSSKEPRLQFLCKELVWWGYKPCLYTRYFSDLISRVLEDKGDSFLNEKGLNAWKFFQK